MPLSAVQTERAVPPPVSVAHWGSVEYGEARRRQVELSERRLRGEIGDLIVVVEHPAVITLGRHAPAGDILCDRDALTRAGIALARSDRGGRATYHGPGQAVLYPVVAIAERRLGVQAWVAMLEDALLDTLEAFSIAGRRVEGRPGIWVGEAIRDARSDSNSDARSDSKVASIGLRVARGVSYHGVSINVEAKSKTGFAHIVTCGVREQRVTSIEDELARMPARATTMVTVAEAAARFCEALTKRLSGQSTT